MLTEDGRRLLTDRSPAAFRAVQLETPPAVGDWVGVEDRADSPAIVAVAPRVGVVVRRDPADKVSAQVVAANVDVVLCVFGLDRPLRPRRVERVLVLVNEGGADAVIVLTKADLAGGADKQVALDLLAGVAPGVEVHVVSVRTGEGVTGLARYLTPERTVALLGESGAGKSSLVNTLGEAVGDEVAASVGEVRARDAAGRHTTTARRLFRGSNGGALIDTPGLRSLGLWDSGDGVEETFADVAALAQRCRFRDCSHGAEPGCAVRRAIAAGELTGQRLNAYVALRDEVAATGAKAEAGRRARGEGRRPTPRHQRRRRPGATDR